MKTNHEKSCQSNDDKTLPIFTQLSEDFFWSLIDENYPELAISLDAKRSSPATLLKFLIDNNSGGSGGFSVAGILSTEKNKTRFPSIHYSRKTITLEQTSTAESRPREIDNFIIENLDYIMTPAF